MNMLSEARQTEFLVGKPCRRAYLSEALSDAPLPVKAQSDCIASIDEDSSLITLFPVEATGALRAASNHSLNPTPLGLFTPILPAKLLHGFVPEGLSAFVPEGAVGLCPGGTE